MAGAFGRRGGTSMFEAAATPPPPSAVKVRTEKAREVVLLRFHPRIAPAHAAIVTTGSSAVDASAAAAGSGRLPVRERFMFLSDRNQLIAEALKTVFRIAPATIALCDPASGQPLACLPDWVMAAVPNKRKPGNGVTAFSFPPVANSSATASGGAAAAAATAAAASADTKTQQPRAPPYRTIDFTADYTNEHSGINCDNCHVTSIAGTRYKCSPVTGCADCDYCAMCYAKLQRNELTHPATTTGTTTAASAAPSNASASNDNKSAHQFIALARSQLLRSELPADSLYDTITNILENTPELPFIGTRKNSAAGYVRSSVGWLRLTVAPCCMDCSEFAAYEYLTYSDFQRAASSFGCGMRALCGTAPRSMLGILSTNCAEWCIADWGCLLQSFVSVPLHPLYSDAQLSGIIQLTAMRVLVVSVNESAKRLSTLLTGENSAIDTVVVIDTDSSAPADMKLIESVAAGVSTRKVRVFRWTDVIRNGRENYYNYPPVWSLSTDIMTITFTSGTTAGSGSSTPPDPTHGLKGIVSTEKDYHANMLAHCRAKSRWSYPAHLEYLPLAWSTARENVRLIAVAGGSVAIMTRTPVAAYFVAEMVAVNPNWLIGVPVVWDIIFHEAMKRLTAHKEQLVSASATTTTSDLKSSPAADAVAVAAPQTLSDSDYAFLSTLVPQLVGTRCTDLTSGGASTSPFYMQFLRRVFGAAPHNIRIVDSYGTTEVGSILADGLPLSDGKGGSVSIKLLDVPELGYCIDDKPFPRGEICVKTRQTGGGYYKNPELTREYFVDGGTVFRTGDIATIEPVPGLDGKETGEFRYRIIDRRTATLKLSNGEFVSPEQAEALYLSSAAPLILSSAQMCVCGEIGQSFVAAIVALKRGLVLQWLSAHVNAEARGLAARLHTGPEVVPETKAERQVLDHPLVTEFILSEFRRIGAASQFSASHIPRAVHLTFNSFSGENGQLTPTFKLCRPRIRTAYAAVVAALYATTTPPPDVSNHLPIELTQSLSIVLTAIDAAVKAVDAAAGDGKSTLSSHGLNSIESLRLVDALNSRYKVTTPIDLLFQPSMTIADVARFIKSAQPPTPASAIDSKSAAAPTVAVQSSLAMFEADRKHAWKLTAPTAIVPRASVASRRRIVITGATGFVGRHLLHGLLTHDSSAAFVLLVRPPANHKTAAALAFDRLVGAMKEHDLWSPAFESRVTVTAAYLELPRFGLSDSEYSELCTRAYGCDAMYHAAAHVNWLLPYSALRGSNVLGTSHVLQFAVDAKAAHFHHISTLGAGKSWTEDEWSNSSMKDGDSGYVPSKWMSELIVRTAATAPAAAAMGLTVTIYRPGTITGHSNTGHCHRTDFVPRYIETCLRLEKYVSGDGVLELTPVDVAVAAIIKLSAARESNARTAATTTPAPPAPVRCYNLCNGGSESLITYRRLGEWIALAVSAGASPVHVPKPATHTEWYSAFRASAVALPLAPLSGMISSPAPFAVPATDYRFEVTNTAADLKPHSTASGGNAGGVQFPVPITASLIATYVKRFLATWKQ